MGTQNFVVIVSGSAVYEGDYQQASDWAKAHLDKRPMVKRGDKNGINQQNRKRSAYNAAFAEALELDWKAPSTMEQARKDLAYLVSKGSTAQVVELAQANQPLSIRQWAAVSALAAMNRKR